MQRANRHKKTLPNIRPTNLSDKLCIRTRSALSPSPFRSLPRWDEDVFGLEYDLDLFNIVAVDDFNMGE